MGCMYIHTLIVPVFAVRSSMEISEIHCQLHALLGLIAQTQGVEAVTCAHIITWRITSNGPHLWYI